MSGSLIGGVVGGVIGAWVGGPTGAAWGYSIGAALGGYVDPAPGAHTYGPQLSDLSAQSADYGGNIVKIIGRGRVNGNLIYCQSAQKHTHTQGGGKGSSSPTVTTYSYTRTFAVALCEGEAAVLRVWVGGKLVYDASSADPATLMAQVTGNDVVTIYPGSETQMPDADIAAAMAGSGAPTPVVPGSYQSGSAATSAVLLPAFRGTCYLVFPDYDVTDYGGYTPPIAAEVVSTGGVAQTVHLFGPYPMDIGRNGGGELWRAQSGIVEFAGKWDYDSNNRNFDYRAYAGSTLVREFGPALLKNASGADYYYACDMPGTKYGLGSAYPFSGTFDIVDLTDGTIVGHVTGPGGTYSGWPAAAPNPEYPTPLSGYGAAANVVFGAAGTDSGNTVAYAAPLSGGQASVATIPAIAHGTIVGTWTDGSVVLLVGASDGIHVYDRYFAQVVMIPWANAPDSSIWNNGQLIDGRLTYLDQRLGGDYLVHEDEFDGSQFVSIWVSSAVAGAYSPTVGAVPNRVHEIERHRAYVLWYKDASFGGVTQQAFWLYTDDGILTATEVTAEQVILALCEEGGLTATDIDASTCSGITMAGYARTKVTTPRAALQPLLQAFQIDAIESGATYKFVPRGQGAVITVDPLDLGCFDEGSTPPSELQSTRTQAAELPRQVTITYQDTTRDCQSGSQIVRRLDAPYSGVVNMQFPGLLTPNQAAQIADVTLRTSWRERMQRSLQLPHTYLRVEPGDILQWAGYQMRVTRTDGVVPGTIQIQALDEYPADYSSAATGMTVASASALAVSGPTDLLVLDIPALRDADATHPGLYLAACGYLSGWRGCALQRSADGGASWTQFGAIGLPGVIGQTVDALGSGPTTIVDRGNSVTVRLFSGVGSLAGITEAHLLAGLNTLVIGSELVGVQNVTLNTDGTYTLDTFLRGRYGTEDAVATHQAGERVMLLTGQGWVRQDESASSLGALLEYRAPSAGQYGEQADVKSITFAARSSKPWSPCHLVSAPKSNGNKLLTWLRRTRLQTSFQSGLVPLGEDAEQYDLELLDNAGAVVRTVSALTSPNYTYTAADQSTDGNAAVSFRVYQISATVGRGMPAEAAL